MDFKMKCDVAIQEYLANRTPEEHRKVLRKFFQSLSFRETDEPVTMDDFVQVFAAMAVQGASMPGDVSHDVAVDELGNKTHVVGLGDAVAVRDQCG
jgi:DNA integrity scanning protein DisA with diadenylate cyclase activity